MPMHLPGVVGDTYGVDGQHREAAEITPTQEARRKQQAAMCPWEDHVAGIGKMTAGISQVSKTLLSHRAEQDRDGDRA